MPMSYDRLTHTNVQDFFLAYGIIVHPKRDFRPIPTEDRIKIWTLSSLPHLGQVIPVCTDGIHTMVVPSSNKSTHYEVAADNLIRYRPNNFKMPPVSLESRLTSKLIETLRARGMSDTEISTFMRS